MDILMSKEFLIALFAFLFSFSELVAFIPSIKSNSVFQLVVAGIKKAKAFLVG
jgi:hypothetical protein